MAQEKFPFQDTTLPLETRVDDLLMRLTLDEKISLMEHQNPAIPRLGLPAYSWWNEALHGVARNGIATVYPMPIAMAATFDPDLVENCFNAIATEAVEKHAIAARDSNHGDYTGLTFFTPNINIFRDPRWGRGMETFGEDPYLTGQMGLSAVRGLQGRDTTRLITAACLKHLAVHSGPEGVRHEFDAEVSPRDLWTTYLPAFEYIIGNSNVQQVMCGYNRLNGVPCCTNEDLLVDILRNQWHYNRLLVTDCWALNDCWERDTVIPRHKTHATAAITAKDAFGSEVDLECGSGLAAIHTALDSGYLSGRKINEHVRRILTTRLMVGADNICAAPNQTFSPSKKATQLNRTVSEESLVLLKNNGVLPFSNVTSMAVLGPNADDSAAVLGNYNGEPTHVTTVLKACQKLPNVNVYYNKACNWADKGYKVPHNFWRKVQQSDVIVFVGGLSPQLEGEELAVKLPGFNKGDRTQIELPEVQRQMIKELRKRTGKPIVLVLYTGGAIALEKVVDDVDAIVVAWYGGQEIGQTLAKAFTTKTAFGRLPVTFYRSTQQLPPFEDYNMKERTYRYMTTQPLFPFGYGLNYDSVAVSGVSYDALTRQVTGTLTFQTRCGLSEQKENTAAMAPGKSQRSESTVVQVYLQNLNDSKAPIKTLIAFAREQVNEGHPKTFSITLPPEAFRVFDEATQQPIPAKPGSRWMLQVGTSSADRDLINIPISL